MRNTLNIWYYSCMIVWWGDDMFIGRLLLILIRKVLVAFVSYFFLPYITIFITKLFKQEVARNSLGAAIEHLPSIMILMSFLAIGSFAIEYIWGRREIQIPFAFIGVHAFYFTVVLFFYLQGWVYIIIGIVLGILFVILDRVFNYWARMTVQYEEDTSDK